MVPRSPSGASLSRREEDAEEIPFTCQHEFLRPDGHGPQAVRRPVSPDGQAGRRSGRLFGEDRAPRHRGRASACEGSFAEGCEILR